MRCNPIFATSCEKKKRSRKNGLWEHKHGDDDLSCMHTDNGFPTRASTSYEATHMAVMNCSVIIRVIVQEKVFQWGKKGFHTFFVCSLLWLSCFIVATVSDDENQGMKAHPFANSKWIYYKNRNKEIHGSIKMDLFKTFGPIIILFNLNLSLNTCLH